MYGPFSNVCKWFIEIWSKCNDLRLTAEMKEYNMKGH
jgi:hypothetical protein